jgi:hypothetical protein
MSWSQDDFRGWLFVLTMTSVCVSILLDAANAPRPLPTIGNVVVGIAMLTSIAWLLWRFVKLDSSMTLRDRLRLSASPEKTLPLITVMGTTALVLLVIVVVNEKPPHVVGAVVFLNVLFILGSYRRLKAHRRFDGGSTASRGSTS